MNDQGSVDEYCHSEYFFIQETQQEGKRKHCVRQQRDSETQQILYYMKTPIICFSSLWYR